MDLRADRKDGFRRADAVLDSVRVVIHITVDFIATAGVDELHVFRLRHRTGATAIGGSGIEIGDGVRAVYSLAAVKCRPRRIRQKIIATEVLRKGELAAAGKTADSPVRHRVDNPEILAPEIGKVAVRA